MKPKDNDSTTTDQPQSGSKLIPASVALPRLNLEGLNRLSSKKNVRFLTGPAHRSTETNPPPIYRDLNNTSVPEIDIKQPPVPRLPEQTLAKKPTKKSSRVAVTKRPTTFMVETPAGKIELILDEQDPGFDSVARKLDFSPDWKEAIQIKRKNIDQIVELFIKKIPTLYANLEATRSILRLALSDGNILQILFDNFTKLDGQENNPKIHFQVLKEVLAEAKSNPDNKILLDSLNLINLDLAIQSLNIDYLKQALKESRELFIEINNNDIGDNILHRFFVKEFPNQNQDQYLQTALFLIENFSNLLPVRNQEGKAPTDFLLDNSRIPEDINTNLAKHSIKKLADVAFLKSAQLLQLESLKTFYQQKHSNPYHRDHKGRTALHYFFESSFFVEEDLASLGVAIGEDLFESKITNSPIKNSRDRKFLEMAKFLIEVAPSSLLMKDFEGQTPIDKLLENSFVAPEVKIEICELAVKKLRATKANPKSDGMTLSDYTARRTQFLMTIGARVAEIKDETKVRSSSFPSVVKPQKAAPLVDINQRFIAAVEKQDIRVLKTILRSLAGYEKSVFDPSFNQNEAFNIALRGDNLEVLKIVAQALLEQVKPKLTSRFPVVVKKSPDFDPQFLIEIASAQDITEAKNIVLMATIRGDQDSETKVQIVNDLLNIGADIDFRKDRKTNSTTTSEDSQEDSNSSKSSPSTSPSPNSRNIPAPLLAAAQSRDLEVFKCVFSRISYSSKDEAKMVLNGSENGQSLVSYLEPDPSRQEDLVESLCAYIPQRSRVSPVHFENQNTR